MIITTGKAWLVCIQFQPYKERFIKEDEARQYAANLARLRPTDIIEIFVCCNNLKADIPVVEAIDQVQTVQVK